VLYLARQSSEDPGFGAVKLNKLLFFADFEAFRLLGSSITGATYEKEEYGPVAREFLPMQDELLRWDYAKIERRDRADTSRRSRSPWKNRI